MNMETPRTDKAVKESNGQWSYALVDTCKQLERELAQLTKQRDVLRVAINNIEKAALTCGCCGSIEVATKIDKIINNIEETK
jgi:hypothetical protein